MTKEGTAALRFDRVSFFYEKDRSVLRDVTFEVRAGERVGLVGANGAGKSTLLKILLGLLPCQGSVLVDGAPVCRENLAQVRRKLGYVLQDSDSQMFMPTVYEDMMFAPLNYGLSRPEAEARVDRALARLGLEDLKYRYNHKISGGEKRMAAIAVVLAMEPEVLLMDEPSTALDPANRRRVVDTLRALPQTMLIASHDLDLILDTCGRVLLLSGGRVAADGPAEEILRDKELLENNRMELPLCLAGRRPRG